MADKEKCVVVALDLSFYEFHGGKGTHYGSPVERITCVIYKKIQNRRRRV